MLMHVDTATPTLERWDANVSINSGRDHLSFNAPGCIPYHLPDNQWKLPPTLLVNSTSYNPTGDVLCSVSIPRDGLTCRSTLAPSVRRYWKLCHHQARLTADHRAGSLRWHRGPCGASS